jgi:hypothetical protein
VHNRGARLVILLLRDPHLLEGGEGGENGTSDLMISYPKEFYLCHSVGKLLSYNYLCTCDNRTAPCIMFWMRAYTLRGEVGGGWALEFLSFLGPVKWERADRGVPFGAQKI